MTLTATYQSSFGEGTFAFALKLCVDPTTGDVLIADQSTYDIRRHSAAGDELAVYGKPAEVDGDTICGIAVASDGKIWLGDNEGGDAGDPQVYRLSADGVYEAGYYTDWDVLRDMQGLSIGPDGKLYATSAAWYNTGPPYQRYAVRMSSSASYETTIGTPYTGNDTTLPAEGEVRVPTGIVADASGNVYVADVWRPFKFITKFSADGEVVARFGGAGTGDGQFTNGNSADEIWYQGGMGMDLDASDRLFVADKFGNRVNVFDTAGTYLGTFGAGTMSAPVDVACGANGTVYVLEEYPNLVSVWSVSAAVPEFQIRGVSVVVCGDVDC